MLTQASKTNTPRCGATPTASRIRQQGLDGRARAHYDRNMIKGLHHNAYRCRDSEQTRRFYEDFLGLELANAFEINETKSGRKTSVLHSFYQLDDGSFLAFFEAPDMPFEFKDQHDYDLHIALEVSRPALDALLARGKAAGVETRGISDHGFIESIYFRDPNGYVIELTARREGYEPPADAHAMARETLDRWQVQKPSTSR